MHYFRNLINELQNAGHKVVVTAKNVPIICSLLKVYGIPFTLMPRKGKGIAGKILMQLIFDLFLIRISIKNKIDIAIGTSISITHLSFVTGITSVFFEDDDDEVIPLSVRFGHPFATLIASPECLRGKKKGKKVIFYPGYHELAYLHPLRFSPDKEVLETLGIKEEEKFFLMRFSALDAHHDRGIIGISKEMKLRLLNVLIPHGRVFITSEKEIEPELESFRLPVEPHKIHSLLYYCHIFIGDSQTMTSEAAVLGVPSLRCNSFAGRISYLQEQEEKYGLTFAFHPDNFENLMLKLSELLSDRHLTVKWRDKRNRMLRDMIDVTSFWYNLVVDHEQTVTDIAEDKNYFNRFR